MQEIPTAAVPSQSFSVTLGGQNCRISLYQRGGVLYLDLAVANVPVITGCACRDRTVMVRSAYLGFTGDIGFVDTQATSDPVYTGLGTRFVLVYFTPTELTPFQIV